jgi:dTDP-4-dehydrorhamnose reductase
MKVLVTGAAGMLGRDLVPILATRHEVVESDIDRFDITDPAACLDFVALHKPEVVVNLAAYTAVDDCESHPDLAFRVNAEGPGHLARACERIGSRMVHISTDYVFDGRSQRPWREEDRPMPKSAYGKSKHLGEIRVTQEAARFAIVRTAWLYGPHGKNFVEAILRQAEEKDALSVVDDQRGSPTYTVDLAMGLEALIDRGLRGVYHITNSGETTWFGFALRILSEAGIERKAVPITTEQLARPAVRPLYSVLDISKFERATGMRMRPWEEGLGDYMRRRSST